MSLEKLITIIEEADYIKNPSGIKPGETTKLKEDLLMDSFSVMLLYQDLERELGKEPDPMLFSGVSTIGDLYDRLNADTV
ncbi:MAG: acyl carrier protein [Lachnospiraceae bacterium]|nr:acyl carrier protein [Lachnospiraceae bacterium]